MRGKRTAPPASKPLRRRTMPLLAAGLAVVATSGCVGTGEISVGARRIPDDGGEPGTNHDAGAPGDPDAGN